MQHILGRPHEHVCCSGGGKSNDMISRQKNSPRSSSLGRKSRTAFAKSAIWQFRSQMATELIT